jgi:hypothetical protein
MMLQILGFALLAGLVAFVIVEVLKLRAMQKHASDAVFQYVAEIEDHGCRMRVLLRDGRRMTFVVDPTLVYQMSNDLLVAAGRLGATHPLDKRDQIRDPELLKLLAANAPKITPPKVKSS